MTRREALSAFREDRRFRDLLHGAQGARSPALWLRVVDHLETESFLARQADRPGGLDAGARQLESQVLPELVDLGDWPRFLRYMATAIHLCRVAELLHDPLILRALVRNGRSDLAEAAVDRLADPADRIDGWVAMAAAAKREGPEFAHWTGRLGETVDAMLDGPGRSDAEVAARCRDSLVAAGRSLAVELRARWGPWTASLGARTELGDDVRLAVVEGFFDAGRAEAPELWELVSAVESRERLYCLLPEWVSNVTTGHPRRWWSTIRRRLWGEEADPALLWHLGLVLFGHRSESMAADWAWLRARLPAPRWDVELLESGRSVWGRLPGRALVALSAELSRDEDVALLWTLVAELRNDEVPARRALALLRDLPVTRETTGLRARALNALPATSEVGREPETHRLLARLGQLRYDLPAEDLCRAIDEVARGLPRLLGTTLDLALSAATSGPRTLRLLAQECTQPAVIQALLADAERHAAAVATDSAEGFELRRDLLSHLALRRTLADRDLAPIEAVLPRLLPAEEDRLRREAARALRYERSDLAFQVCDGIREDRVRVRTRLEIASTTGGADEPVTPTSIYREASGSASLDDEIRALGALLESPARPAAEVGRGRPSISSPARRIEALIDRAWHTILHQERHADPRFRDPSRALEPLRNALGVVESDEWLVALIPELVALGSRLGPREATAEVQEGILRVVGTTPVSWAHREAALVAIWSGIAWPSGNGMSERAVARLFAWLVRLPGRMGDRPGAAALRCRWHRLLPVLVAVAESRLASSARVRSAVEESARCGVEWRPDQEAIFELCRSSADGRVERAERLAPVEGAVAEAGRGEIVWALAWLLSGRDSERSLGLLESLPAGSYRDRTLLELVRYGPFPVRVLREIVVLLHPGSIAARWARVWLGVRAPEEVPESEWMSELAALVALDVFDPGDPHTMPIRRRSWALREGSSVRSLARATVRALARGGPAAGERALRVFLSGWIRPTLGGEASAASRRRHRIAEGAFTRARSLEHPVDPAVELGLRHPA